jgi:hypothetical protein
MDGAEFQNQLDELVRVDGREKSAERWIIKNHLGKPSSETLHLSRLHVEMDRIQVTLRMECLKLH